MSTMLGNLSIEDMERRTGVTFPDALKEFMADRHQPEARNVKPGKWHCFYRPFLLVCGDIETATAIYEVLKPLGSEMAEPLQIGVQTMTTKNTGRPAFPLPVADQECHGRFESGYGGMSLRDYFAARMMMRELGEEFRPHQDNNYRNAAIRAYRMADAMLKAREET